MKTAVIYARYSSDSQTEQSIDGQLRVCEEYAKKNNILIVQTYIDRAMTGTNDKRPDFQQMLKDSYKKQWDYVLVYKLDRFSRNKYESVVHKKTLKENGVKLISAMENIPDSPEGIILESLLEGMNQYYSAELAQKIKRGMHETRLKGLFQGGALAYGYKVEERKIIIDLESANVVKYIFEQYDLGMYASDIVNELNSKGIKIKGKKFIKNTIYKILRNEKYTGIYKFKDEVITNMYPKIIETEQFNKIQSKFKHNRYGRKSDTANYLLRKKLTCGYCGKSIIGECGTDKRGNRYNYYKCLGIKNYHSDCIKKSIRQDFLEQTVIDLIINELNNKDIKESIINKLLTLQSETTNNNVVLLALEKEQKQYKQSLNNLVKAIEQGVFSQTTNSRLNELESKIEELERNIIIERNKQDVKVSREEIEEYYNQALELDPQLLINQIISEIKLYNDKIEIYFNSPLRTSPDNQGCSFFITYMHNLSIEMYV